MDGMLAVGKIRTCHGVRGEVKILSYSGEFEHFESMKDVTVKKGSQTKTLEIESTRWSGENLLLKFKGIDQRETSKLLADWEIWVKPEFAAPLDEGEVYLKDLIGCRLVYQGKVEGTVTGFLEGGREELLEVQKTDESTCIVPFSDRYLGDIDLSGKTIELRVLWILE